MSLKIVFAGTPAFALPCLETLHSSGHQLKAIYTQPDRPSGRGQKLQKSVIKEWGIDHLIPVCQPLHFRDQETIEELASFSPDVMIVIAYGLILPAQVLAIPRFGCINVHASLLPQWRGAAPIQYAILNGDTETGVTIMQMDIGMDTGAILNQVKLLISPTETSASLHDRLAKLATSPLIKTLTEIESGTINATPQEDESATYAPKIKKEQALILWHEPAVKIAQKIRAFNPWPIAYTFIKDMPIRIHEASIINEDHGPFGKICSISKQGIVVATGEKSLLIEKIQFPGSKIITVADWLNSKKPMFNVGDIFER